MNDLIARALIAGLGAVGVVAVATTIVFRSNKGQLSVRKSYLRGQLHLARLLGWFIMVSGVLLLPLVVTDLTGLTHWGYPWWSVFLPPAIFGIGYGLRRLMKFILADPDWNNMFASRRK